MAEEGMTAMTVRLPTELHRALKATAAKEGRKIQWIVQNLVEAYVQRKEEQ
jgi:predicted transcriptional regulator